MFEFLWRRERFGRFYEWIFPDRCWSCTVALWENRYALWRTD